MYWKPRRFAEGVDIQERADNRSRSVMYMGGCELRPGSNLDRRRLLRC